MSTVGQRVVVHPGDDDLGRIGSGVPGGRAGRGGAGPRGRRAADVCIAVPDDMPLEVAALAEPVAVGMHAAEQADVRPGDTVAVFGCGPIGLAAIATLADRGLTEHRRRRPVGHPPRLARAFGASARDRPGRDEGVARTGRDCTAAGL